MERENWIDWAKVFGIYLVVLGHSLDGSMLLWKWIYSFHMPLFFIISGYLDKSSCTIDFKPIFVKLFKRLLAPYFVFGVVALAVILQRSDFYDFALAGAKLILGRPAHFAAPMWFVFTMFEVRILHICLTKYLNKWTTIIYPLVVLVIMGLAVLHYFGFTPSWVFNFIVAYPFYVAGVLFKQHDAIIKHIPSVVSYKICLLVLSIALPIISISLNGTVDMLGRNFGKSVFLYYLFPIAISYCILLAFKSFLNFKSKFILTLSEGTILILALHMLVIVRLNTLFIPVYLKMVICLLIVAAFYYPIVFCQKFCPILIGKKK